ncbi:hypothetical protein BgiBS90_019402, partial [Biomphalaria glabrata]
MALSFDREYKSNKNLEIFETPVNLKKSENSKHLFPFRDIDTKLPETLKHYNKIIKSVGDLTVKIVNKKKRFSCTGFIKALSKKDGQCYCNQCQQSGEPSLKYAVIEILTATHGVSLLQLFQVFCEFSSESDNILSSTLDFIEAIDQGNDVSTVKCITCDYDLIHTICSVIDRFENHYSKFEFKESDLAYKDIVFLVLHPFGAQKYVSVGYLKKETMVSSKYFVYSNATCKGSSGALVLCPGMKKLAIHSGRKKKGDNGVFYGIG